MIDFHTHIVFDVDDGAQTIEQSIAMLIEAEAAGYTDIILTPHYMEGYYEVPKNLIAKRIELLNKALKENNIKLKLHQSNEIYITNNMTKLLKDKTVSTVAGSKYVLFETPMLQEPMNLMQIIYELRQEGYIPVIAHPERYQYIQKNPNRVYELIEEGALFQVNIGSIIGIYGKDAKNTLKILLKHNMIHFIGTDTHRSNSIYTKVDMALKKLQSILPEEKIKQITYENEKKVLLNEDIDFEESIQIEEKNKIFKKFFNI